MNIKYDKKVNSISIKKNKLIVGIKSIKKSNEWRTLGFNVTGKCKELKINKLIVDTLDLNSKDFIEGLLLGNYSFSMKKNNKIKKVSFVFKHKNNIKKKKFESFISEIKDTINAQTITKDIINLPANISNSKFIKKEIEKTFNNINVKVYTEKDLKRLNMNGHLAVNRGSKNKAMVIKLTYTPKDNYKKHNIFVGKGLTYDSGGLSIKPTNSMLGMQSDKSGAMVLFGFMSYIEKNGSNNKITAYLSLAENMISNNSFRPGDILTMKNKKTVNVKNTDAEGRLVIFDGLCLAQEENKRFTSITSIATLTGAAVYQFGIESAALVSFNNKLKKKVIKIGKKKGELFSNAKFNEFIMDSVNDTVADLSNTGTANMGCQKAGLFLSKSIKKKNLKKFIHWDIAGPSWIETTFGSNSIGATGFGVRTLIELQK